MEFSIKMLVVIILCMIVALFLTAMIFGFGSETGDLMGDLFNFFRNIMGFETNP